MTKKNYGGGDDWRFIVTMAVSKINSVCASIREGDITVDELESIQAKRTQMNKLCEAAASQNINVKELHKCMELRLKEFAFFSDYKKRLGHFLSHIGTVLNGKSMPMYMYIHACTGALYIHTICMYVYVHVCAVQKARNLTCVHVCILVHKI